MIFPHLPKHYEWMMRAPELHTTTEHIVETPLREPAEPTGPSRITVEEWWIKHGLATDPAASSAQSKDSAAIDWTGKDAWEFYALCIAMICWIAFWYGTHRGLW